MKQEKYEPYVLDDTFRVSQEVLDMTTEEREEEIKKYEDEVAKRRAEKWRVA